jgi:hypothetical protein
MLNIRSPSLETHLKKEAMSRGGLSTVIEDTYTRDDEFLHTIDDPYNKSRGLDLESVVTWRSDDWSPSATTQTGEIELVPRGVGERVDDVRVPEVEDIRSEPTVRL